MVRNLGVACLAAVAVCGFAGPGLADVLAISLDGEVATYSQPMIHSDEGVTPVAQRGLALSAVRGDVDLTLTQASDYYGVNPDLVRTVAWQESRGRQSAVSSAGAIGVMQLMPGTARSLGVDPHDVTQNVYGGVAYLGQMLNRYRGDVSLALAAYNAGPGAVDRHGGIPPYAETKAYVATILARLSQTTQNSR